VDISDFVARRVNAGSQYTRQFGPGWKDYHPNPTEVKEMKGRARAGIHIKGGKPDEGFRYYRGFPRL
jgi:hypothetical protein